jgi:hypothetical protein
LRVLICGGRDLDEIKVMDYLSSYLPRKNITIIQGGAKGADLGAKLFAIKYGIPMKEYKADWNKYGKSAGPIRNREMLNDSNPDVVIAFPGSNGTKNMIDISKKAGIKVIEIPRKEDQ